MTVELITVFILVGIFAIVAAALVCLLYWHTRQRTKAERSARELESWVRCLYDKSPDAIFVVSHKLVIRSSNPQASAMLGFGTNELLGRTIGSILPALVGLGTGKLKPQVSLTDRGLEVEAEAGRKDGKAVPVKAWVTEGRANGRRFFIVTLRDAKPAILSTNANWMAERETFTTLLDFSGAAVVKLDDAGQITGCNEAAQFFTGYRVDDLLGRTFWESLFAENDRTAARQRFVALKQSGVEQRSSAFWRKRDGSSCEVAFLIKRSLDGVLLVAVEATEPHAKALGAAQKLAVGVATEFADVLTVIHGYGELLIDSAGDSLKEDLTLICDAARRGSSVTSELLAFGQRLPKEPTLVDLNALISENIDIFQSACGRKSRVACLFEGDLGPIMADTRLLSRSIETLVSYLGSRQSETGRITIRTTRDSLSTEKATQLGMLEGDYIVFSITDQVLSSDLPPSASDFLPFANGTGGALHLAAVYGLTKQNGGVMLRESGKMTTYHLYFPLAMSLALR